MPCTELQVQMINSFLKEDNLQINRSKESVLKQIGFILCDQQQLVENCLELLDDETRKIKRICTNSARVFWKVPSQTFRGANQKDYVCTEKYCPCKSFSELAKSSKSDILCKHLLVIRIGTALSMIVEQVVSDIAFADLMCD